MPDYITRDELIALLELSIEQLRQDNSAGGLIEWKTADQGFYQGEGIPPGKFYSKCFIRIDTKEGVGSVVMLNAFTKPQGQ